MSAPNLADWSAAELAAAYRGGANAAPNALEAALARTTRPTRRSTR